MKLKEAIEICKHLEGSDLIEFCRQDFPDAEFREMVSLLSGSCYEQKKVCDTINRVLFDNKRLYTYYPAFDNPNKIKGKEVVTPVLDGVMYID